MQCPSCNSSNIQFFFKIDSVPVHSVVLLHTRADAISFPTGDIDLGFCQNCGFIANYAFQADNLDYAAKYESTQSFSPTFSKFAEDLAGRLIKKYGLYRKRILEIGCGHGEFLHLICEIGENVGIGFDPAHVPGRVAVKSDLDITFFQDYYSEKYTDIKADFICCKMTLEHINATFDFVQMVRRSLGDQKETIVYFQVPDVTRILKEGAFWDIFYEHCSYFSPGSIARLFRRCQFDVIDVWRDFDDQYLMIEARLGNDHLSGPLLVEETVADLAFDVFTFSRSVEEKLAALKDQVNSCYTDGESIVIWGASSKGVSFLTTLKLSDEVGFAVDINPYKNHTFLPGTGHEVVTPDNLKKIKPDTVFVMNPIYEAEIRKDLAEMGLSPNLVMI